MNFETVPIIDYIVKNTNTKEEISFFSFDEADDFLNDQRKINTNVEWQLYALIDA